MGRRILLSMGPGALRLLPPFRRPLLYRPNLEHVVERVLDFKVDDFFPEDATAEPPLHLQDREGGEGGREEGRKGGMEGEER